MVPRDSFEDRSANQIPIRILIVDAHPLVRAGWHVTLEADVNMQAVGEAGDEQTALALARELSPDVVIVTESLGVASAIRTCRTLVESNPAPGVLLVLNGKGSWPKAVFAESGATQLAFNSQPMERLRQAMRGVAEAAFNARRWSMPPARPTSGATAPPALSAREAAVIRMVAEGLTHREIASTLRISSRTLQTYQARAMTKLDLTSRVELLQYALARGWLGTPLDAAGDGGVSEE